MWGEPYRAWALVVMGLPPGRVLLVLMSDTDFYGNTEPAIPVPEFLEESQRTGEKSTDLYYKVCTSSSSDQSSAEAQWLENDAVVHFPGVPPHCTLNRRASRSSTERRLPAQIDMNGTHSRPGE